MAHHVGSCRVARHKHDAFGGVSAMWMCHGISWSNDSAVCIAPITTVNAYPTGPEVHPPAITSRQATRSWAKLGLLRALHRHYSVCTIALGSRAACQGMRMRRDMTWRLHSIAHQSGCVEWQLAPDLSTYALQAGRSGWPVHAVALIIAHLDPQVSIHADLHAALGALGSCAAVQGRTRAQTCRDLAMGQCTRD